MEVLKERPLVSIVIPVYNREDLVREAIDSALSQTYDNIEIIVVDNCSTDNTWNVLLNYHNIKVKVFQNEKNVGPVLNWKRGIELSNGEYISLLFSDDKISNNFIEESLNNFDDDTAFVLSPIQLIRNDKIERLTNNYKKKSYNRDEYFTSFYSYYTYLFPVSPGASLFRKKDISNAFITNIPTMEDLNPMNNGAGIDLLLYFIVANQYKKISISEKSRAYFREHGKSFTIADSSINHYYFRSMIFFIPFLKDKKYYDRFKMYLFKMSLRDSTYKHEYNMVKTDSFWIIRSCVPFINLILKSISVKLSKIYKY